MAFIDLEEGYGKSDRNEYDGHYIQVYGLGTRRLLTTMKHFTVKIRIS